MMWLDHETIINITPPTPSQNLSPLFLCVSKHGLDFSNLASVPSPNSWMRFSPFNPQDMLPAHTWYLCYSTCNCVSLCGLKVPKHIPCTCDITSTITSCLQYYDHPKTLVNGADQLWLWRRMWFYVITARNRNTICLLKCVNKWFKKNQSHFSEQNFMTISTGVCRLRAKLGFLPFSRSEKAKQEA